MIKTRTTTKEEEYDVCDLCGEEINPCYGNTIYKGDSTYSVHLMWGGDKDAKLPCGLQLIVDKVEKKKK